jgi:hypothetical protein
MSYPSLDTLQEVWSAHLREMLQTLEIPPGTLADNLVASVAMYCRTFHPRGLQTSELKLLIARAFCAVDDRAAAERVLESMEPHRLHVSRWLEILSELHHFPEMLPYFSLGIIRPADWAGAQLDRMWTLDFGRLVLSDAEKHEMMLYRSIRTLVEKMFVFWDATGGEGILGLKDLSVLNVDVEEKKQTLTTPGDLLEYIADLFARQKEQREWHAIPTLLSLDL